MLPIPRTHRVIQTSLMPDLVSFTWLNASGWWFHLSIPAKLTFTRVCWPHSTHGSFPLLCWTATIQLRQVTWQSWPLWGGRRLSLRGSNHCCSQHHLVHLQVHVCAHTTKCVLYMHTKLVTWLSDSFVWQWLPVTRVSVGQCLAGIQTHWRLFMPWHHHNRPQLCKKKHTVCILDKSLRGKSRKVMADIEQGYEVYRYLQS